MYTSLFLTIIAGVVVMMMSTKLKPQYQTPYFKRLCIGIGLGMILISVMTALWLFIRNS
jgi:hypothetical protein